ncbi:unnamed protein product, partial [Rotaria sordida]
MTSKTFRDPVLATDGYTYEREAITQWISEEGISPFTGQPLRINDLRFDDRLQLLAEQYRNEQPPENSEPIVRPSAPLRTLIYYDLPEENRRATKNIRKIYIIIICLLIFLIGLILGTTVVGLKFYLTAVNVTSNYSGAVTMNSPTYVVERNDIYRYEKMTYRYKSIRVIISTSGVY